MSGIPIAAMPVLLTLAAGLGAAQDQTILVNSPLRVCVAAGDASSASISQADAPALIAESLQIAKPVDGTSYILHVVRYVDGEAKVDQSNWYVYSNAWVGHSPPYWLVDPRINSHFTGTRIFGSHRVGLAYMHHNVPAIDRAAAIQALVRQRIAVAPTVSGSQEDLAAAIDADRRQLKDDYQAAARTLRRRAGDRQGGSELQMVQDVNALQSADLADWLTELRAGISGDLSQTRIMLRAALDAERTVYGLLLGREAPLDVVDAATGRPLARLDDEHLTVDRFASLASLTYRIEVTKKTPAPQANLQDALAIAFPHAARSAAAIELTDRVTVCGGRTFEVKPLPADMVVTATVTGSDDKEHQLGRLTFDNEKKYRYDVSFALPLKSYNDFTYEASGGTVTAKSVTRGDLFAAINLSLFPFDTKHAQAQLIPVLIYGVPITGKPLKHHLVGLAVGLNRVQVWGGWVFNQIEDAPDPANPGRSPGSTWKRSPSFGMNFSVATVKQLLSR